jgi:hypothetical protein
MEKKDIIILLLIFSVAGVRLYQKYGKKNQEKAENTNKSGSSFSNMNDDGYEPYSKK